jgi:hypothetical protein
MTTTAEVPGPAMPAGLPRLQIDVVYLGDRHVPETAACRDERLAAELQSIQRRRAQDTAREAEVILELAATRPASDDPAPGTPGARKSGWAVDAGYDGTSEFFTAELSAILNLGRRTAAYRYGRAHTWTTKLPLTFAALSAGDLDERRADQLADVLQHTDPAIAGQVEAALLPEANDLSVARLKARATEEMLRLDAAAADERRTAAEGAADVHVYPTPTDGRSTLAADLPTDEAVECFDVVDQLATMLKADGDPRRIGELRAHVLSLLIRRPADSGLPPVSAHVTITADLDALGGASTSPGEVSGLPITAAHVRELLARVGALGVGAPDGGSLAFAITGPDGQLLATMTPAELSRLAKRDGPVLGPPPPTDAYAPTDRQRAFVSIRDRRCRFPNCGQRVGWADLDHVIAHSCGGATDCTNLCCLCRSHHRLKTFAPGWHFRMADDGTLHVTTPSGVTRTTRPPGLRPPPEPPPRPPDDDPPPF